jgi:7,8-dihydropterin-6-yl-methyl-4-(beta-D-ribofuranosyl)aminobenzene 5'-phosphate synthase
MPKMSSDASSKMNVTTVKEWTELSENLFITGTPCDAVPQENALVLMTKKGPVLICGCCHYGIIRTIEFVENKTKKNVAAVIGGIHTAGMKRKEVHAVAEALRNAGPPVLYLNHCTGVTQRTYLREKLGLDAVKEFYAGTEIRFDV